MMERTSFEMKEGIAWITLDDGKVNAMSTAMLREISARLDEASAAEAVTVVSGREGIFSAGFDLNTLALGGESAQEMLDAGVSLIKQFLTHPYPILGSCTGSAYAMGAFLLLASDLRIGVQGDWKIGMNEVAIGLTLPPFALALARHRLTPAGTSQAITATMFGPEQGQAHGYLDQLVCAADFEATVLARACELHALDMPSFVGTKAAINERVLAEIGRSRTLLAA